MRSAWFVIACTIAACNSGEGVDIEISAPDGVTLDRVELWITYDQCYDSSCPNGVAWTQGQRADGDIYYLRDEALIKAEPRGDTFVLHLQALPDNADPSSIAIVGYAGDSATAIKVLHYVHIPINSVEVWKVQLHAADPATTDLGTGPAMGANDYRAHVWARRPTPELAEPTGCLVSQVWDDYDHTWKTEYFVPDSDPDCDGQAIECSTYWFDYKPLGRCVTSVGTALPGACVVGMSPCADGVSESRTCTADPMRAFTCLPDDFCKYCADEVPSDNCIQYAVDKGTQQATLPRYTCGFDSIAEGTPCADHKVTLQLPMVNASCASPTLHYVDKPFVQGTSSLVFGTSTNQVKISATTPTTGCALEIFWTSGKLSAFPMGITFLLEVPYTNGKNAIYPVTVSATGQTIQCNALPINACKLSGPTTDHVALCAGS